MDWQLATVVAIVKTTIAVMVFAPLFTSMFAAFESLMAFISALMFHVFVITPVGIGWTAMVVIPIVGLGAWSTGKHEKTPENGRSNDRFTKDGAKQVQMKFHTNLLRGRGPDWFRDDVLRNQTPVW
jgi:hypothetical protein